MAKANRGSKSNQDTVNSHGIYNDVMSITSSLFRNSKDVGADKIRSLAEAARQFATSISDMPNLGSQISVASETIDDFADYVVKTDIDQIVHDGGVFVKRHPVATIATTVAAGVGITLLLRTNVSDTTNAKRRKTRQAQKSKSTKRRASNEPSRAHA